MTRPSYLPDPQTPRSEWTAEQIAFDDEAGANSALTEQLEIEESNRKAVDSTMAWLAEEWERNDAAVEFCRAKLSEPEHSDNPLLLEIIEILAKGSRYRKEGQ